MTSEPDELSIDYLLAKFENDGRCLSLDALVSSAESMTRLIELIKVCRNYMALEGNAPTDELDTTLRTMETPTLKDLP